VTVTCVEGAGEPGEVVFTGEEHLPWGVDAGVVIVGGVREARFLAALMRTFTVDGIFTIAHTYLIP